MNQMIEGLSDLSLLVNGRALRPQARTTVENPSTGELLTDVTAGSTTLLDEAVGAAGAAAPKWARDVETRQRVLGEMAKVVVAQQALLAQTLALELGLPLKIAAQEAGAAAAFLRYRATTLPRIDTLVDDALQNIRVVRAPIGVVGAIVPWNAPLMMACEKIGTAFAAGNTVVLKPSPLAPLTVMTLGMLVWEIVPAGVLNILHGGEDLGPAMVAHPGIGMISFTGSTTTGRRIMAAAATTLKRLSLELGGNDAAIVLGDVDVARTAEKLFGAAFYRSGQICVGVKRLYVRRRIFDPFVVALRQIAEAARAGDPFDAATTLGPLSNRQQFEKVKNYAASATAEGGSVLCGGALDRPGFFFSPALVTGLGATARLVAEEQFGPILPILAFDDEDEAVAAANDTAYGLGNSVWTDDLAAGQRVAQQLLSGSVWINRHGLVLPHVPFGGMKQSGIGRANGDAGLDHYCELKTLSAALPRKA
ncbi:MAG: aldehyde dehydrogenase family protein [Panacagrimonas sp.]